MVWIIAVSILVSLAALLSLWGTLEDRRNLVTGSPTLETLVSYTGIADRDVFIELLGEPDELNRFPLPLSMLNDLPQTAWQRFFDTLWTDIACVVLSAAAPIVWFGRPSLAIGLLFTSAVIQAIGYGVAAVVLHRSGILRELLENDTDVDSGL